MPLRRRGRNNRRGATIILLRERGLIFASLKTSTTIARVVGIVKFVIPPVVLQLGVGALAKCIKRMHPSREMVVSLVMKPTKIRVLFVTRGSWAGGDSRRRGEI